MTGAFKIAMGAAMMLYTPTMAFVQILGGALLVYSGVIILKREK